MTAISLGKVPVSVPGTPVPLSSVLTTAQLTSVGPSRVATKILIEPDNADTGISYVKDTVTGNKIAVLPVPVNGCITTWHGEMVDPTKLAVDNSVANDGPFVTIWVA